MATQVGVSSGEGGQAAPGSGGRKPNLAPKPHLMPKPFSLEKKPMRQISAPKPSVTSKPVTQTTTAPSKPVPTTARKPTPSVSTKPDLSGIPQLEETSPTTQDGSSPKPAPVVAPKPDLATHAPDIVSSPATPEPTTVTSKPEPTSLSKAPPTVAPKPAPSVPIKPDQTNVAKPNLAKGSDANLDLDSGSVATPSHTAEQNPPEADGEVEYRGRTRSMGYSSRKIRTKSWTPNPDAALSTPPSQTNTETSDAKTTPRPLRNRLSADLTSMFEASSLSMSPSVPLMPSKNNIQATGSGKKEPVAPPGGGLKDKGSDAVQTIPEEPIPPKPKPTAVPRREWKKREEKENENEKENERETAEESGGGSIKRRISMLLDSSTASQQRDSVKKEDQPPVSPAEISVDVKQRIKELRLDPGQPQNAKKG